MTFLPVVAAALGDTPPPNAAPVVNVGGNSTVAPSTQTLTFTATDPDGDTLDATEAGWTQTSGPATLSPAPPTDSRTWSNVVFTTPGTYVLQAYQVDPRGAIGIANKTVTVTAVGGAGNQAEERLGLFARTSYNGSAGRPPLTQTGDGAVIFTESYWEADGLRAKVVREIIGPQTWSGWKTNINGYFPQYKELCQSPRNTVMLWACPMFTGDAFSNSYESMRLAYAAGANGDYIGNASTTGYWTFLRNALVQHGYGVDFPVYIDPCSEYDLGVFPNIGQAGRMNFGRMDDGAECVRAFYEYLSATCPLLEMGTCRISSGATPKYMNVDNTVHTFGGVFPAGLNMSEAILYKLNQQSSPLTSWFTWLAQNMYFNSETQFLSNFAQTKAAATAYGIATGSEEWGVAAATVIPDNLALRQFLDRQRALFNGLSATGGGSLKFNVYFEGLGPNSLYQNYPQGLAHFKSTWHV